MAKITRVEHVGIVVRNLAEAIALYERLGLKVGLSRESPAHGLKLAFLPVGESQIELLEPTNNESLEGKFLEEKGPGIHHICLGVDNIDETVKELMDAGVPMVDKVPRMGGRGRKIAFLDPAAADGVALELRED